MKPFTYALDTLLKTLLNKYGPYYARIVSDWYDIVGYNLARYTFPKKIVFPDPHNKKSGTLHIEIAHSSIATELTYTQNIIMEKIAVYFGYKAVTSLKLIHNPVIFPLEDMSEPVKKTIPPEQEAVLNDSLNAITDENLKASLYNLGRALYSK